MCGLGEGLLTGLRVLLPQRFAQTDRGRFVKISTHVRFPLVLDLTPFVAQPYPSTGALRKWVTGMMFEFRVASLR